MSRAVAAGAVLAALLAAGCSSSVVGKSDNPVVSLPPSLSVSAGGSGVAPPTSAPPITVSSAAPSAATTSASAGPSPTRTDTTSAAPAVQRSTCTKMTIRVIPGGASMGQEIAAVQFTNDGSSPCQLVGYPAVTLLLNGKAIGRPSQPASTAVSSRSLAPGETAESLLHDYVGNCQAPLSDTLRVVAPGSDQTLARPLQMRACTLRADRLGAPD